MGFSYLGGKNWSEITRDERYFCAELFSEIKQDVNQFVKWLNEQMILDLNQFELDAEWEIGYEVCFYRDLKSFQGRPIKGSGFSQKRTFDLCLFSQTRMIIIEAKSQTGFGGGQNESFANDPDKIMNLLEKSENEFSVNIIGLASSKYLNSKRRKDLPEVFKDKCFTWEQIFNSYCRRQVFLDANDRYGKFIKDKKEKEEEEFDPEAELDYMFPNRHDDDFDEDSMSHDSVFGED